MQAVRAEAHETRGKEAARAVPVSWSPVYSSSSSVAHPNTSLQVFRLAHRLRSERPLVPPP